MAQKLTPLRDLGLSYDAAAHGIQTATAYAITKGDVETTPKHLRVGIDMSKSDQMGLARLLIDKGLFTLDEYTEYMRLAANDELVMREAENDDRITFR